MKWRWYDNKMRRIDSSSNRSMHGEGESERFTRRWCQNYYNKIKIKIKHMSIVYGDFHKTKSKPNLYTNPLGVPIDETKPRGRQFHAVSRQKLFQTYNFSKFTLIEGYNGKYGSNPQGIKEFLDVIFKFDQIGQEIDGRN